MLILSNAYTLCRDLYQLRKRILCPSWGENLTGAFRVDVTKPVYTPVSDTQVAKFSGHLTVSHKTESEVV